jgi:hypothetical protein
MQTLVEKIIKMLSKKADEQYNPIVKNFIKNTIDDINNEVFEEVELFKKYEYQYNLSNGVIVTETLPCNLLNEFFNSKSDANKYLDALQQKDLENDFSEYVKNISYAL